MKKADFSTKDIIIKSPDSSLEKIEILKDYLLKLQDLELSETDTRCKMIDLILKDILFWDESNITREESLYDHDNEKVLYIDYIFESNDNKFLIEAKKNGVYFNTPTTAKKMKRTGALSKDVPTRNALQQSYDYCIKSKIDVGCICNGHQFIVFIINNTKYRYDTYVFNSINTVIDNFIDFINIFSPYSNAIDELNKIFENSNDIIRDIPQYSETLNNITFNSNEKINRNPIDTQIIPIIKDFFTDLVSENTIKYLQECYCENLRINQYNKQLTSLLTDEMPRLGIPMQGSEHFDDDFLRKEKQYFKGFGKNSDVMMLVGGVGAGKTTFIHRYFNFILPEYIRKNIIWIYIDFTNLSDESINIREYILKESLKQIREKYQFLRIDNWDTLQDIYRPEITRLKNGALNPLFKKNRDDFEVEISRRIFEKVNDEVQFSEDVLKYISMKQDYKKLICLSIDNADQKTEQFQIQCLKASYEFSKNIKSLVLLSLREESYWKLRNVNPFDAFSGYAYHISAPSVGAIIGKRIEVACKYMNNRKIELISTNNVICQIKIKDFLNIIKDSLYKKNQSINTELFEALSAGNLRYAAEMLRTFLISGHTNTVEYIQTYLNSGDYTIPFHAFVRSISLGDYKYYHSDKSLIFNMLKIDADGFYSHLTKIRILNFLNKRKALDSVIGKGYYRISDVFSSFKEICNNEESFRDILTSMLKYRLIRADNGYDITGRDADYIKLTSAGFYYLEILLNDFSYLERLCEDSTIKSKLYFEQLHNETKKIIELYSKNHVNKREIIKIRLNRISIFLDYLKDQEHAEEEYIRNEDIKGNFIIDIIESFNIQKFEIQRSANHY